MATKTINARIKVKSDTDEAFGKATFVPNDGEPVFYETSKRFKIGDGTTKIGDLPFVTLPLDDNIVDVGALDNDTLYFSNGNVNVGGTVDASAINTDSLTVSGDAGITGNASVQGTLTAGDIESSNYITATKTITAEKFITREGTSSQFVRGDGSLGTIPTSLKNPNALNIKTASGTVTYDGSSAQVVDNILSAENDSSGNKITDTYVKKSGDTMTGALVNNVYVQAPTFYIGGTSQYMQYNSTTGCVEIIC